MFEKIRQQLKQTSDKQSYQSAESHPFSAWDDSLETVTLTRNSTDTDADTKSFLHKQKISKEYLSPQELEWVINELEDKLTRNEVPTEIRIRQLLIKVESPDDLGNLHFAYL